MSRFRTGDEVKHKTLGDLGVVLSEDNLGRIVVAWTQPVISMGAHHVKNVIHDRRIDRG